MNELVTVLNSLKHFPDENNKQEMDEEFNMELALMPDSDRSIILNFLGTEENAEKCFSSMITFGSEEEASETALKDSLMSSGDDFWIIKITEDSMYIVRKTTHYSSATIQGITHYTRRNSCRILMVIKVL